MRNTSDVLPKFLRSDHVQSLLRSWSSNTSSMEGDPLAAPPSTTTATTPSATSNTNASQPFAKLPTLAAKPLPFAIDSRHHCLLLAIDAVLHLIRLLFSVGMPSEESSFSPTEHTRAGALNAILQLSETIRNSSVYQPVQPEEQSPEPNLKKQAVAARNVIEHHLLAWRKKFEPAFAQQATSGDCRTTTPRSNGVTETGIIAAILWTLRKEATAHLHALADNDEYSLLVCNNSFQSVIAGQTSDVESIAVQQEITQLMDVLTLKLQSQDSQAHPSPSTALSATTTPTVQGITTKRRRKPSDPNTPISDEKLVLVGRILLLLTKQVASIEGQQDRELRVAEIELAKELVRATSANACLSDADRHHMRAVMLSAITQSRKRLSAGDLSDCSVLQALLQGYRNLRTITMY
ncbi:Regulator of G-protein signaling 5, variant 2 [Balamuthia mandrillaris]